MSIYNRLSKDPGDLYLASLDQGQVPRQLRTMFVREPRARLTVKSLDDLKESLAWAGEHQVPVIVRGSGSSGFGQILPRTRALVLDLSFLNRIIEVDEKNLTAKVEAGVRWSDLDGYLKKQKLTIGSYPSSYYTTIAGWVSTGGSGLCAYKFGPIRDQIFQMEVLDSIGKLHVFTPKNREWDALFASEGQVGIIYSVTLGLRSLAENVYPFLVPFETTAVAMKFIETLAGSDLDIIDLTYLSKEKIHHLEHNLTVKMERRRSLAPSHLFKNQDSVFVLFENSREANRFTLLMKEQQIPCDLGRESRAAASLVWFERFYPMKGKGAKNFYLGNEVTLPLAQAASYAENIRQIAAKRGLEDLAMESHIVKGKSPAHCLFMAYYAVSRTSVRPFQNLAAAIDFDFVARRLGGKIYPIGIYKTPLLHWKFSMEEIAVRRRLKQAFDPQGLFNPGKFFHWGSGFNMPGNWLWHFMTLSAVTGMKLLSHFSPLLDTVLGTMLARPEEEVVRAIDHDPVVKSAFECVQCGFCLTICPAYLATQDEKTTARGKLMLYAASQMKNQDASLGLSAFDAKAMQMCMHCGGCTKVCQSEIDLVPSWYRLEENLVSQGGHPRQDLKEFVHSVERSSEYHRLLREGAIIREAPQKLPASITGL